VPERTCVGCRHASPKPELLRIVRSPTGAVAVDRSGRAPGRGAYVHRSGPCVDAAMKRSSLVRSLRATLDAAGAASLMREIEEALQG
jgi:predicted RNA-binding protein YlxR (DUF448 family)